MHRRRLLPLIAIVGLVAASATLAATPGRPAGEGMSRTLYVTVTDSKGAAVPDLTAADFQVKEGGKAQTISKAAPATAKMRISIMADERLIGDGSIRVGIFEFAKRLQPAAEFAIYVVGLRNDMVVDYTSDMNAIVAALNKLTLNPNNVSNFGEGVLDLSKRLKNTPAERPVIVAIALPGRGNADSGEIGSGTVTETLNALRASGAQLHAVTLVSGGGSGEQIIEEGAKQSGGRRTEIGVQTAITKALQQIADDLSSQYAISYTLPDGVKPDKKVSVTLTRKGLTFRAPTAVPDK